MMALTWLSWTNNYQKLFWETIWFQEILHNCFGDLLLMLPEPKELCLCVIKHKGDAKLNLSFFVMIKCTSVYVLYVPSCMCY